MNKRIAQALALILSRDIKNAKRNNAVLLMLPMGLGDAVLYLDTIDYYFEKYKNNHVYLMTTSVADEVFKFSRPNLKYSFIEYNPIKMDTNVNYFLDLYDRVGSIYYEEVVYPLRGFLTMDLLYGKIKSDRKITIDTLKDEASKSRKVKMRDFLIRNTDIITFLPSDMDLIRYARIAEKVCGIPIKARLPHIKINKTNCDKYCQISIGSSRPEKCWPIDKYSDVTKFILRNTEYNVVFTGSNEDGIAVNRIIDSIGKFEHRIINKCGQTSLIELFSIISNASLLIGGDSGPIHVSVACDTPAICIVGGWDYERMYPYRVEIEEVGRTAPIVVNTGIKSCYRCLLLHGSRGATNPVCSKMIKSGKPCLCIDDISSELVIDSIKKELLKRGEILCRF